MGFWEVHGILGGSFLCLLLAILPRFTLLFVCYAFGAIGITSWGVVGWFFTPRLLIAIIGTTIYWDTNPILCVFAWIIALCGESAEKTSASKQIHNNSY